MADRPILFSAPMVLAIFAGWKTVTRRVRTSERCPYGEPGDRLYVRESWAVHSMPFEGHGTGYVLEYLADGETREILFDGRVRPSPPEDGSRLAWCMRVADRGGRPSIHMPRWASRLTLDVLDVRAERLQEITGEDVLLEGVGQPWNGRGIADAGGMTADSERQLRDRFRSLWDSINASRKGGIYAWGRDPCVWRVEFRVVTP